MRYGTTVLLCSISINIEYDEAAQDLSVLRIPGGILILHGDN
jgi:hypothetical protein